LRTLADLKPGESGIIKGFADHILSLKLMEMGCIPGADIKVVSIAPMGDPMAIKISGYMLGLRKSEAAVILLELKSKEIIDGK